MIKFLQIILLIGVSTVFTNAQNSDDYNKNEFFAGYARQVVDDTLFEPLNGFEVSYTRNVSRYFGLKADLSGTFASRTRTTNDTNPIGGSFTITAKDSSSIYNFLGGVQIKDNASKRRLKPFAHALVGAGRVHVEASVSCSGDCLQIGDIEEISTSRTGFSAAFGGGLDIRLNKKLDLRVIQLDYNPIYFNNRVNHTLRLGIGIVIK